jgi:hypothetical protein
MESQATQFWYSFLSREKAVELFTSRQSIVTVAQIATAIIVLATVMMIKNLLDSAYDRVYWKFVNEMILLRSELGIFVEEDFTIAQHELVKSRMYPIPHCPGTKGYTYGIYDNALVLLHNSVEGPHLILRDGYRNYLNNIKELNALLIPEGSDLSNLVEQMLNLETISSSLLDVGYYLDMYVGSRKVRFVTGTLQRPGIVGLLAVPVLFSLKILYAGYVLTLVTEQLTRVDAVNLTNWLITIVICLLVTTGSVVVPRLYKQVIIYMGQKSKEAKIRGSSRLYWAAFLVVALLYPISLLFQSIFAALTFIIAMREETFYSKYKALLARGTPGICAETVWTSIRHMKQVVAVERNVQDAVQLALDPNSRPILTGEGFDDELGLLLVTSNGIMWVSKAIWDEL